MGPIQIKLRIDHCSVTTKMSPGNWGKFMFFGWGVHSSIPAFHIFDVVT